ncbi:tetratricopeptide repeat protein [Alteraurantiacibacter aestuarii]|uniref:Tetratricopeptide repeat protein n=1 Tax=Alteraurantiacibacter aestuarii TaxID=650004 RepID=A0A844ZNY6_9SPHN|nr:tetratricopeptide repeat protein [Alteraurantiacibacter aestuarii]MXO89052.1 tetratricopeptide repeat protein [Alteraurantiacibacter aestuarii]
MYSNACDALSGDDPAAGDMSVPVSLEELRAAAENAPDDAQAWQRLAFAYFTSNMFPEAVEAYEKAVEIAPDTSVLWSSLGEARVMASTGDPLPEEALQAFRRALEIDSGDPRARYFMAVEKDLAGDHQGAIGNWLALLADTPPGAPWENDLVRTIEQVGTLRDIEVGDRIVQASRTRDLLPPSAQTATAMGGIPGPTQEQLSAASSIPPSQQQDMAESMVARLAARLEDDPSNVDGWIMLMRSYITLDRQDAARTAYRSALQANPAASAQLREAAETLGLQNAQ